MAEKFGAKQPLHTNFERALTKLETFLATPATDERDRAGVIQAFEFTFEQCWKALQKLAHLEGAHAGTPREALKVGIARGILAPKDEDTWIRMLPDRNLTSHLYQESLAYEVFDRVKQQHAPLLRAALTKLALLTAGNQL